MHAGARRDGDLLAVTLAPIAVGLVRRRGFEVVQIAPVRADRLVMPGGILKPRITIAYVWEHSVKLRDAQVFCDSFLLTRLTEKSLRVRVQDWYRDRPTRLGAWDEPGRVLHFRLPEGGYDKASLVEKTEKLFEPALVLAISPQEWAT